MTATVEQMEEELARLVRLAVKGEEVLITEAGYPVARLVGIPQESHRQDRAQWVNSLRKLREATRTGKAGESSDNILADIRRGR